MKTVLLVLLCTFFTRSSLNMCEYTCSYKLKIYYNNTFVTNDSLEYFEYPTAKSRKILSISSTGQVICDLIVRHPCSTGMITHCEEIGSLDCDIQVSEQFNSDSLTFRYRSSFIKIKNQWRDILKLRKEAKPYLDVVFVDTLRFE